VEVGGIEPSPHTEDTPGPHQPSTRKRAARQTRTVGPRHEVEPEKGSTDVTGPAVEVGGIEPPSHEVSASASPSAADSELSEPGRRRRPFLPGPSWDCLTPPVPTPRWGHPALLCPDPARQAPSGRTRCV